MVCVCAMECGVCGKSDVCECEACGVWACGV